MSVVHVSEKDAVRDFAAVLARLDQGDEVTIDRQGSSVRLAVASRKSGRTVGESIAILQSLPGEPAYIDAAFARDVESFRDHHSEGLDGSKWD